jgi:cellulose synthase/poly-beta-1,6-N-acetylglucosamine synthase-like glycosyltransferase
MIEPYFLIFWAAWLILLLLAALRVSSFGAARRWQDRKWKERDRNQQAAAVIVPVKGFDIQATPRFFDTLLAQDYLNYRVIVCFESWDDPVAEWLQENLGLSVSNPTWTHPVHVSGLKSITLISAGPAQNEGQKVHNQIAAFRELKPEDKLIAFADADVVFKSNWLVQLLAPLNLGTHQLATTYRWLVPTRPTLPNQFASIINGSIATQGGTELLTVLWGGSMAMNRELFEDLKIPKLLSGSLNDDLRISKAARKAGNRIAFIRSLILPTPIDFTWRSFFEFAKRQYTQVKFFSPILYVGVNFVLGFYALGALSLLAALAYGYFYAWIPIAAACVIDQIRGLARQQVYLSLFPEKEIRRKLFQTCWLEHMLTPVWMLMHQFLLVSTWTQNRITWAGIRYQLIAKDKTKVLHRSNSFRNLPLHAPGLAIITEPTDGRRGTCTEPINPPGKSRACPVQSKPKSMSAVDTAQVDTIRPSNPSPPKSARLFAYPSLYFSVPPNSSATRFSNLLAGYPSPAQSAFRMNPRLQRVAIPKYALMKLSRYEPPGCSSPLWAEKLSRGTIKAETVRLISESARVSKIRRPRSEVILQRKASVPHRKKETKPHSRLCKVLKKHRLKPTKYPRPDRGLASINSLVPYPTEEKLIKETPLIAKEAPIESCQLPLTAGRSHDSITAPCYRTDRSASAVTKSGRRSGRADQLSTARRQPIRIRPLVRKASGRHR